MVNICKALVFKENSVLQSPSHARTSSRNNTSLSSVHPLLNIRSYLGYIPDNAGSSVNCSKLHHQVSAILFLDVHRHKDLHFSFSIGDDLSPIHLVLYQFHSLFQLLLRRQNIFYTNIVVGGDSYRRINAFKRPLNFCFVGV